jgi:hypothetical protein
MNIAPSGVDHDKVGFQTEAEAIAAAYADNTGFNTETSTGARRLCQSGYVAPGVYRNTPYKAAYMSRQVLQRSYHVARHVYTGKYYCESVPIRLGDADSLYTGWLDSSIAVIVPDGGDLRWEAILNRTIIENCRRRGIVECMQKMTQSKMDLAETFADIDKTALAIAEKTWQVLKAFQFARKGNWRAAAESLGVGKPRKGYKPNSIFDGWLALQYGWLPLLNDIYSGVELAKEILGDPVASHTYAKRRTSDGLWAVKLTGNSSEWLSQSSSGTAYVDVETKFRFKIENQVLAYLSGFKMTNPLYIAWVAMPLTFIVDWFLPIGDWLDSLTATHGLTFVDGYQTTITNIVVEVTGYKRITWRHIWNEVRPAQLARSRTEAGYIDRTAFASWPMRLSYFKFPFSSPTRIANAIALTRSLAR